MPNARSGSGVLPITLNPIPTEIPPTSPCARRGGSSIQKALQNIDKRSMAIMGVVTAAAVDRLSFLRFSELAANTQVDGARANESAEGAVGDVAHMVELRPD